MSNKNSKRGLKKDNIDINIYKNFLGNVDINSILLANLNVSTESNVRPNEIKVDIKFGAVGKVISENMLDVACDFTVDAKTNEQEQNDSKNVFKIQFSYNITYDVKELSTFSKEYIDFFVLKNVPINIWPYARELVSSLTTRMGYPPLILEPYKDFN